MVFWQVSFFNCSVDSLLIFPRSLHTYKMPNKPITQGYKIYGIADHGYLYNFLWSSREKGLQDILLWPGLTKTGCLVRNLALSLPRRHLTIYMDNYFTSIPLFTELRACEFGVMGTTWPYKEFPAGLKELKERYSTKLKWNTLLARVVQDTLCLAWQDNNIVLALSNIHTVHQTEDFREKVRKRPPKTSTNGRIVRPVFGDAPKKELQIPCFIDDYNQYMGSVDLANQFRESYETHRITLRVWWPLFYWLIDVACINAYRLYQLHMIELQQRPLTHLQFRTKLYCKLLEYSEKAKLHYLQIGLGGRRVWNPDLQRLHYWEKRAKQSTCAWCAYELKCQRIGNKKDLKGIQARRSIGGCVFCKVAICKEGYCWDRFHSNNVNY